MVALLGRRSRRGTSSRRDEKYYAASTGDDAQANRNDRDLRDRDQNHHAGVITGNHDVDSDTVDGESASRDGGEQARRADEVQRRERGPIPDLAQVGQGPRGQGPKRAPATHAL